MEFFFIPGTCALAVHIACHEAGIHLQLRQLERTPTGLQVKLGDGKPRDYMSLNPKGKVPAIRFHDGGILTENQAILQYIAWELTPKEKMLIPQTGPARWRAVELLNFITTDLHKGFSPLLNRDISAKHREAVIRDLGKAFTVLQDILGDKPFLLGEEFSVADCYAWTVLTWTRFFDDIDLAKWPRLVKYRQRILHRPSVQKALEEEGLKLEL
ncbi:hypothetical protein Aspvir_002416 [Aspergillus viridinutans]|uniref:Glutathione S-transferase n=1 Tax=Aspergillus viridinutans TaxID=75553 RepID=A0A9P3C2P8_ASPVI|nr:uncharacterized protein Aspvir_002416 [Aspergillus viridinutans]GIK06765.1 hypothetical protein Aspvir_002416 [Aspergillus viridinutans]